MVLHSERAFELWSDAIKVERKFDRSLGWLGSSTLHSEHFAFWTTKETRTWCDSLIAVLSLAQFAGWFGNPIPLIKTFSRNKRPVFSNWISVRGSRGPLDQHACTTQVLRTEVEDLKFQPNRSDSNSWIAESRLESLDPFVERQFH